MNSRDGRRIGGSRFCIRMVEALYTHFDFLNFSEFLNLAVLHPGTLRLEMVGMHI